MVQIISVIKVCVQPDGFCSPGSIGFDRALAQTFQAIIEFYLFFVLSVQVYRQARARLSKLPYAQFRGKHLAFQLLQTITIVSGAVIFLYSLLMVIIFPFENWVCGAVIPNCGLGVANGTALAITGINSLDPAFLTAYLLLVNWAFFLAQGYLPAGSHWCMTREEKESAFERNITYTLREPEEWKSGSPAELQRVSNVLSIETEILLFNFTNAVYMVDSENSKEDNSKCVSDGFELNEYIVNHETDTHVLVCSRDDRIILAFRGTVSAANVRTDTDFKMAPYFDGVNDSHSDGLFEQVLAVMGRDKPLVHSGFLKAIQSVQASTFILLHHLLREKDRPIMFTGRVEGCS